MFYYIYTKNENNNQNQENNNQNQSNIIKINLNDYINLIQCIGIGVILYYHNKKILLYNSIYNRFDYNTLDCYDVTNIDIKKFNCYFNNYCSYESIEPIIQNNKLYKYRVKIYNNEWIIIYI